MISSPVIVQEQGDIEEDSGAGVRSLVEQLISHVFDRNQPDPLREGDKEQVVLDIEVGGVRCVLIRSQIKQLRAQVALSPREQEIARMVAKGYPNKIIADILDISSWTVCTHLRRIFAKFGVSSRAAMVARLLEEGSVGEHSTPGEKPRAARKPVAAND